MTNVLQHGGSEVYKVNKLIEDYSVTTNYMGPSFLGLIYMKNNLLSMNHYPPTNKNFFKKGLEFLKTTHDKVLWGNGASELIDLSIRYLVKKFNYKTFTKGEDIQFMEYERSCINNELKYNELSGDILIIINPNNPTGKYMNIDEEFLYLVHNKLNEGGTLILDESMLFWIKNWEEKSGMFNYGLQELLDIKRSNLIIVHSWTKIFSCTGLRFGSIWSNNPNMIEQIETLQVPWSVNILAFHYLNGCLDDRTYLRDTLINTPILRESMRKKLLELFPFITIHGEPFLSWLWIDFKSNQLVNKIHKKLFDNGILIRKGEIGYKQDTFIRIAVRNVKQNIILFRFLEQVKMEIFKPNYTFPIDNKIIYGLVNINEKYLLRHENVVEERKNNLKTYLENNDYFILPSIIVCSKTLMIIDGHHRFEIYKEKNVKEIPVLLVNYDNQNIITHPLKPIDKNKIIDSAISGECLIPKTTKHLIKDCNNVIRPLISLSILIN
jgi:histidinol-phosphate/aromatic aminotransferase/cobyric acid decarboxylase-like protein